MSTASIAVQGDAGRLPHTLISAGNASKRLLECSRILRRELKKLQGDDSPVATWLIENHSYVQFQIRETRRALPAAYLRMLPKSGDGGLRVYGLAADLLAKSDDAIDAAGVAECALALKEDDSLVIGELWAFGAALKLALIERLCANLDSERTVALTIGSLRAIERVDWRTFAESISIVERTLERDPAGVYARMDFLTRDAYRHKVEWMARQGKLSEREVAERAIAAAEKAEGDERARHVGYYLIGDGALDFRRALGCRSSLGERARAIFERCASFFYISGILLATAMIVAGIQWLAGSHAIWISVLLAIPASQAAIEIVNTLVNRALAPRSLPSMDFSDGIPDEAKTMVVVPTLLLSSANAARLLEDLEIRYLANRGSNLYFALLTDFPDADSKETPNDAVLIECKEGIGRLNARYGSNAEGPFYLFHRPRRWNQAESKWMGYERKRGKLNDLNRLLIGGDNPFSTVVGDVSRLTEIRYVITLDTDTQLPLDTAAKMVAAAAHPLNRPILDSKTGMVKEGYALIRPRVAVSMESAGRSRLAHIYSGQTGFDPYATAVSDVYQDLYGQASFTGKGIYDLRTFEAAVGDRFPENAILSHDLIEGEYARTGLLTSVELVEDFPATYEGFSKRNHRWVRGDWQLLPWLGRTVPAADGARVDNPLPFLSRWKMVDNLRRSLFEIFLLLLFAVGWLALEDTLRWTAAILALLLVSAYADMALTIVSAPERRFWRAFVQNLGERVAESHRNALLSLIFIPHQACMMADAIGRTLARKFVTRRKLLEWETMAQSESANGAGVLARYLYLSCGLAVLLFMLLLSEQRWNVVAGLVCMSWMAAPLAAGWLNEPLPEPEGPTKSDREFLRAAALRTWRFFADHADAEHHWLVPDNVQQTPEMAAHRTSPTNLGLLLNAQLAAFDFGYVNIEQLRISLRRLFDTMEKLPRHRGHFFNWYDTQTLAPEGRRFVSSVDSGNLAAALCAVGQGCLEALQRPAFGPALLDGLRDHTLQVREELPYGVRSGALMRLLASVLRQLESEPGDLFHFGAVLRDCRDTLQRSRPSFQRAHERLENQGDQGRSEELQYWEDLLFERLDAALEESYTLAPWLSPAIEPELRLNISNPTLTPLFSDLSTIAAVGELPQVYARIQTRLTDRLNSTDELNSTNELNSKDRLYPALRLALEELLRRLPAAQACAEVLIRELEEIGEQASRMFEQMDYRFLFDSERKLLRVGYDADSGEAEESCYDLLASEARTAVFLAIAKGDIPREAWFRLGRKLTAYRNRRTLVSWSGTMFEYLMPLLHMRSYENTLLDSGARGAVAIQQLYARERGLPWGISEAAYSARDEAMQYQYQAFGVPPLSAISQRTDRVVVAPYASMLALMLDPHGAAANLRSLAAKGCLERYGFCESIEYSTSTGGVELIRTFMAHHQAMGLLAIDNALLGGRMQERFHSDPRVQATEFLLQERMPALVETLSESEGAAA